MIRIPKDPLQSRIEVHNWIFLGVVAAVSYIFGSLNFTLGVLAGTGFPAIAQSRTKVKVGYLHTPAVDGQIWTGQQIGPFDIFDYAIDIEAGGTIDDATCRLRIERVRISDDRLGLMPQLKKLLGTEHQVANCGRFLQ